MKRFRDTHYWITDDGRVWNERLKRYMRPHSDKRYLRIELSINKSPKKFFVHRLVAECYLSNPEDKPTVNHIDGNPSNNHVTNLEWATVSENTQHAYDNGLAKAVNRKFGKEEILNIYYLHKRGHSMRSIGRLYNSCHKDISHILRGKTYKEYYAYY